MRLAWCIPVLASCDQLFGIQTFDRIDASTIDAAIDHGCSDGTREGFQDENMFRSIAACSGAWVAMGLTPDPPVLCGRMAGNDGVLTLGDTCSATDLCNVGWHVCRNRLDVLSRLPVTDRTCGGLFAAPNTFFATAQSGPGGNTCGSGTNDVFGCGTYGLISDPGCDPLNRSSDNQCFTIRMIGGWSCTDPGSEVTTVYKTDPTAGGGVLCCADDVRP